MNRPIIMREYKIKMENNSETDLNYESTETESEYFSVTDSVELTQSVPTVGQG